MNPYVADFTLAFLNILTWAIIARSLLTWFPIDQSSPLFQLLFRVTEPVIDPFRRVIPNMGMIDLSPLAAIIALLVMGQVVLSVRAPY
jgi:YggT family protein